MASFPTPENIDNRFLYLTLAIVAILSFIRISEAPAWSPIIWDTIHPAQSNEIYYAEQLIPNAGQNSSHSVSSTVLPSGDLIAFWFAGSREGHKDVQIYQTTFHNKTWAEPKALLNVPQMNAALGRYIGKLGNPLVFVDSKQRMWLFFVTVSYGGWAGSNLNVIWSDDLGQSWTTAKRLVTSPFLNVSTLVRNNMYELEDGSLILPVYHEFVAQFPEVLRVSREGEVISKRRIHGHGGGIQPVFVEGDRGQTVALMRSGSHSKEWRVFSASSQDDGQSWQNFKVTGLPNPNSAQVALRYDEKSWLWVGNHNQDNRKDMTLALSSDLDGEWQVVHRFERGEGDERFSYPTIRQGQDGVYHLMYTYNRKNIKHIQFNRAWLEQQQKVGQ